MKRLTDANVAFEREAAAAVVDSTRETDAFAKMRIVDANEAGVVADDAWAKGWTVDCSSDKLVSFEWNNLDKEAKCDHV